MFFFLFSIGYLTLNQVRELPDSQLYFVDEFRPAIRAYPEIHCLAHGVLIFIVVHGHKAETDHELCFIREIISTSSITLAMVVIDYYEQDEKSEGIGSCAQIFCVIEFIVTILFTIKNYYCKMLLSLDVFPGKR